MRDSWRTFLSSIVHFTGGTLFSRVTGLVRDVVTAYAFGTQASVAALMVAFRLSHCLRRLLGEGALQGAFTPCYEELRQRDATIAAQFFCDLRAALTIVLILCIVVGMGLLSLLNVYDVWSDNSGEVAFLTFLLLPGLLFICLYGLQAAFLQCHSVYWVSAAAPAWLNIGWILGAYFLAPLPAKEAMPLLAICIVVATFWQWAVTVPACHRALGAKRVALWHCQPYSKEVLRLVKPLFYSMVGVAAGQVNSALDALFARYADPEGPAYLWYAIRLQQLPLALFSISIAGALLPPLSRAAKSGDEGRFHTFLHYAWMFTLALMVPSTGVLMLKGSQLITLIYGHGDFGIESIRLTEECLMGYSMGLIPMGLVLALAPAFYAKGEYRSPMQASMVAMFSNLALNVFCISFMGWGSASIAWTTGVSAWINLALLCWRLPILYKGRGEQRVAAALVATAAQRA